MIDANANIPVDSYFHLSISVRFVFIFTSQIILSWLGYFVIPFSIDANVNLFLFIFLKSIENVRNGEIYQFILMIYSINLVFMD